MTLNWFLFIAVSGLSGLGLGWVVACAWYEETDEN